MSKKHMFGDKNGVRSVLIVIESMNNNGTEAYVVGHSLKLNKRKYSADFLVTGGLNEYYRDEIVTNGGKLFHLSKKEKQIPIACMIRNGVFFFKIRNDYDIIYVNSCSLIGLLESLIPAKILTSSSLIAHSHHVGDRNSGKMGEVLKRLSKHMVSSVIDYGLACSLDAGEGKFSQKFLESGRFKIINNAIDLERYSFSTKCRDAIREKHSLTGKKVIGAIGRLERQKNQGLLVSSLKKIIKDYPEAVLLLVGSGSQETVLREMVSSSGLQDHVVFTGSVNDAAPYYSAMDILCLPSSAEGLPFVLVEAQANGLDCLISDRVTVEAKITSRAHYLSIDNAVDVWADAIVKYWDRKPLCESDFNRLKPFSIEKNIGELEEVFETVMQSKARYLV